MAEPAAERVYPIVYLDALIVKIRDGHTVRNQACYVALGVNLDGERDVLEPAVPAGGGREVLVARSHRSKTALVARTLLATVDEPTALPGGDRGEPLPHAIRQDGP